MHNVIAICGEAGTGKDTLLKAFCAQNPWAHEIISCTTRPPREGEKDGVNYHFLSDEQFEAMIKNNVFIEYANFNNWYYGTSIYQLNPKGTSIGVFNPEGIRNLIQRKDIDVYIVRLFTSPKERLLRQLNREDAPDVNEIIRRYQTDQEDFKDIGFSPNIIADNSAPEDIDLIVKGMSKWIWLERPNFVN